MAKHANQIRALLDVPCHRVSHRPRIWIGSQIKVRIERKQSEVVMMGTAGRRTGSHIRVFTGTIRSLFSLDPTFFEAAGASRNVVDYPMYEGPARCIGVLDQQDHRGGSLRDTAPYQRRRMRRA